MADTRGSAVNKVTDTRSAIIKVDGTSGSAIIKVAGTSGSAVNKVADTRSAIIKVADTNMSGNFVKLTGDFPTFSLGGRIWGLGRYSQRTEFSWG